jgi:hypothetical protein
MDGFLALCLMEAQSVTQESVLYVIQVATYEAKQRFFATNYANLHEFVKDSREFVKFAAKV